MTRPLLARSLLIALAAIALTLAVVAGLAVASLYQARQDYEERLRSAYAMETAGANLLAAGTAEEAAMIPGAPAPAREAAAAGFDATAGRAGELAGEDPPTASLVAAQVDAQTRARTSAGEELASARAAVRTAAAQLSARQRVRRDAAKARVDDDTREQGRRAGVAGGLALLAALLAALVAMRRRPLARLLRATRRLAAGELHTRLNVRRPRDLRKLAIAFNAMAADLETAESVIDDQRQQLAKASEGLGDAVLMCDGKGRILEANPRAGMLVPELSVGHDLNADRGPLPPLKKAATGEVEIEHRGRTLSVTARPLGESSENGVAWTIRDVFEHARLERLKSELVGTAAHELRSPLSSVNGFAGVLRTSRIAKRQRDLAEIVLHATNCLLGVVDHVLDIARAEPGQMEIHRRSIALAQALKEVAALMRPRLQERNQTLDLHVAPELPPAYAEPAKVRQLIADLLTVAHRHAPDGGRLSVSLASGAGEVVLATSRSGPELTDEQREQVLERVRSLVDAHGRRVEIEPEPGWGSTVVVHLPQAPTAADPPPITAYANHRPEARIRQKIG